MTVDRARLLHRLEADQMELDYARKHLPDMRCDVEAYEERVVALKLALGEAERCALLAEALAERYEASGAKHRADGSYTTRALWPFGKKVTCVRPGWQRAADVCEAAGQGLRTIARACREGWDTRKPVEDKPVRNACYCDLDETACKAANHPVSEQLKNMRC